MNQEDIIRMAREAGFPLLGPERTKAAERFADLVAAAAKAEEREACAKTKAGKRRNLKAVGLGILLDEQQYCFDKGWREGDASVRAAFPEYFERYEQMFRDHCAKQGKPSMFYPVQHLPSDDTEGGAA